VFDLVQRATSKHGTPGSLQNRGKNLTPLASVNGLHNRGNALLDRHPQACEIGGQALEKYLCRATATRAQNAHPDPWRHLVLQQTPPRSLMCAAGSQLPDVPSSVTNIWHEAPGLGSALAVACVGHRSSWLVVHSAGAYTPGRRASPSCDEMTAAAPSAGWSVDVIAAALCSRPRAASGDAQSFHLLCPSRPARLKVLPEESVCSSVHWRSFTACNL
jgi:hypothetical protein